MSHLTFKTIFISDLHIGSDITNHNKLFKFLESIECDKLFLVGDIIYRNIKEDDERLTKLIDILNSKSCEIIFIIGNHEISRKLPMPKVLRDIKFHKSYIYKSKDKKYLIEHGDSYDTKDKILQTLKKVDKKTHVKIKNRAIKAYIKKRLHKILKATAKVVLHKSYSKYMSLKAKKNRCNGVICGHFHKPNISKKYGIEYYNCGDWDNNCTYIAEDFDGKLRLYRF